MRRPLLPGTPDLAPPALFVITGVMAAGKSTIAQALAERLPNSVHLRGDVISQADRLGAGGDDGGAL